ncbi:hypothetical protein [Massilia sp. CF038]|uniref:MutS-related protein n=1 Tax=Massilia sp. CF038 TaxID=1881045 RepID=UPI0009341043|nr:hypothetical protein [Massilia sp. CF038]
MPFASAVRLLRALFDIPAREPADYPFVESDQARLQQLCHEPGRHAVDDATWSDLMLGQYHAVLSQEVSIFGQQALYQRLREGAGADAGRSLRSLVDAPAQIDAQHLACKPLRHADQEIATLLFAPEPTSLPIWAGKTWCVPFLLLGSMAAAILWSPLAWLGTGALLFFLMSNQVRYGQQVEQWQRTMLALQMLLRVASETSHRDAAEAARVNRALTRAPASLLVPGLRSYQDWFALTNVNHYFHCTQVVQAHLPLLRATMLRIADWEADIALARHLRATPRFCWAERASHTALTLRGMVHPLLPAAQALSLELAGKGAFISGQNGIGKSTLLRTAGLNLIAARAFGFCYAETARVPDLPIYCSMQNDDSLLRGESLYIAELRRASELLAAADGPHPGICIIDEIFRGTNHLESVSAAASVLDVLAQRSLVLVSSHNLVLASLLQHRLDPLCVSREDGALTLSPGVLAHTNGIRLLAERGFGPAVQSNAGKVFDWLNGYLAHPADSAGVLG